jgi:hypothetical protein
MCHTWLGVQLGQQDPKQVSGHDQQGQAWLQPGVLVLSLCSISWCRGPISHSPGKTLILILQNLWSQGNEASATEREQTVSPFPHG